MERNQLLQFGLFLLILFLILFGLLMVWSSSAFLGIHLKYGTMTFLFKQLVWIMLGMVMLFTLQNIDYLTLRKWAKGFLFVTIILLGFVLLSPWGVTRNGAQRWLDLGFVVIQPSEFAKLAIIIYIADFLTRKQREIGKFWNTVFPLMSLVASVLILIVLEPNRSTTIFIFLLSGTLWFIAGGKIRHIITLSIFFGFVIGLIIYFSPEARSRIMSFIYPDEDPIGENYQLEQSKIAMATGGITGIGLGESRQKHKFLPEAHTDFIFSIVAEELGYISAITLIISYILLILTGVFIANRAPEVFGFLVAAGITFMIGGQATMNLAVTVGLFPTTGVALPFLSYGGSSMIVNLTCMGILLNIAKYAQN